MSPLSPSGRLSGRPDVRHNVMKRVGVGRSIVHQNSPRTSLRSSPFFIRIALFTGEPRDRYAETAGMERHSIRSVVPARSIQGLPPSLARKTLRSLCILVFSFLFFFFFKLFLCKTRRSLSPLLLYHHVFFFSLFSVYQVRIKRIDLNDSTPRFFNLKIYSRLILQFTSVARQSSPISRAPTNIASLWRRY